MKKRIFLLLLIVPVFLAGCTTQKNTLTALSERQLASGQQLITGQVKSISGNEIVLDVGTYRTAQRNTTGQSSSQPGASASKNANGNRSSGSGNYSGSAGTNNGGNSSARASGSPSASASGSFSMSQSTPSDSYVSGTSYGGQRLGSSHSVTFTDESGNALNNNSGRSGSFGNGQFPGNFGGSQEGFPSGAPGAMPSGGPQGGNGSGSSNGAQASGNNGSGNSGARTSGGNSGSSGNSYGNFTSGANGFSASRFQSSGQTMNLTIPVGTTVLTTSNNTLTTTTFGKILAKDIIQIIVQTDADGKQTVLEAQILG